MNKYCAIKSIDDKCFIVYKCSPQPYQEIGLSGFEVARLESWDLAQALIKVLKDRDIRESEAIENGEVKFI